MIRNELPADVTQWTRDPYTLLNVSGDVDFRSLRHAYFRLIRVYRPERFPEQFRRIREAYEIVQQHLEYSDSDAQRSFCVSPQAAAFPVPPDSGPGALELDDLWEWACLGEEAEAYRELLKLDRRQPGQEDVCLRLYWLLVAMPELDANRDCCDWLFAGLRTNSCSPVLRGLLRFELSAHPSYALARQVTDFLTQLRDPYVAVDIASTQWIAARKLGKWNVIAGDLQAMRGWIIDVDEASWMQLLLHAVNHLSWAGDCYRDQLQNCREEIDALDSLHARFSQPLEQMDFLEGLVDAWREMGPLRKPTPVQASLRRLVAISWGVPFTSIEVEVRDLLQQIAGTVEPVEQILRQLQSVAPVILCRVESLFEQIVRESSEPPLDTRQDHFLLRRFVAYLGERNPRTAASRQFVFLQFCLDEVVVAETLFQVIRETSVKNAGHSLADIWQSETEQRQAIAQLHSIADELESDMALRCLSVANAVWCGQC